MEGSFRDLHLNTSGGGGSNANGRNLKNRSPTSAAATAYGGGDVNPNMNNYSTFSSDQARQCSMHAHFVCVCVRIPSIVLMS